MSDGILIYSGLQPTGSVSFGPVRDGQEITVPLTFTANDAPDEQDWYDNGAPSDIANVAMYFDAVILVDGDPAAEIYEWEPVYELETRELRMGGQARKGERFAGYKPTLSLTMYKVSDSRLFRRVVEAIHRGRPLDGVSVQCIYRENAA
jgi:hypothetical protein